MDSFADTFLPGLIEEHGCLDLPQELEEDYDAFYSSNDFAILELRLSLTLSVQG